MTTDQQMRLAIQLHQSGKFDQASEIYGQVLDRQPRHARALHLLGMLERQRGNLELAVELIEQSIVIDPDSAEAQAHLGDALRDQGKFEQAVAAYGRAVQLSPGWAEAQGALGNALKANGQYDEAIAAYRRVIELNPSLPEVHNNLGEVYYEQKNYSRAIEAYAKAIRIKPDFAQAYNNLGNALSEDGNLEYAIAAYLKAVHFKGDYADAFSNLGLAYKARGEIALAVAAYRNAVRIKPDLVAAVNNLATVLRQNGQLDEAEAAFRQAVQIAPDFSEAHNNLGNCLKDQAKLTEAIASFDRAIALRPEDPVPLSNRICAMHFHPDYDSRAIYEMSSLWNQRHAVPLAKLIEPHENDRSSGRRLRIGYVSPDIREHPIGRFILPLLEAHNHGRFEIFCYSDLTRRDAVTERAMPCVDTWRETGKLSDEQLARVIRGDRIDILVDLSMHMANNRLRVFARKPAPVQVTWLAYCSTTGLAAIDYRLTDWHLDPETRSGEFYSEKSIRLPDTNWCYQPGIDNEIAPVPAFAAGHVTFGCLNNFCKVTPGTLEVWCEILRRVTGSRLMLHASEGSHRRLAHDLLETQAVDPARLSFVGFVSAQQYFQNYNSIDIALDPFPYVGGTTTCDSLWMGVPVVTLAGNAAHTRPGVSMLSNVGLERFIATTTQEYIAIAQHLANDLADLVELRKTLRPRMQISPLMDARRYAARVEDAYRLMWDQWRQSAGG